MSQFCIYHTMHICFNGNGFIIRWQYDPSVVPPASSRVSSLAHLLIINQMVIERFKIYMTRPVFVLYMSCKRLRPVSSNNHTSPSHILIFILTIYEVPTQIIVSLFSERETVLENLGWIYMAWDQINTSLIAAWIWDINIIIAQLSLR